MKFKINSTGNTIIADQHFMEALHPGDYTLLPDAPVRPDPAARILTHTQFRRLFTKTEREDADELEETFKSNAALTQVQKRTLRSGYKDFNMANEVDLDDEAIPPMLVLYVLLGILTTERSADILAGRKPNA